MNNTEILTKHPQLPEVFAQALLSWYQKNARALPWRENTDPYRIWVSEIMLQQTRVEAVRGYFTRFIARLPDLKSLAAADEEALLKLWEGLGYYSRVRNLQRAAREIEARFGGEFPQSYDALLSLPGIGAYTAGAICSIAFDQPTPAVDGNVLRVMTRLTAFGADISEPATKRQIAALLETLYPRAQCGLFTQSLMELGATVCVPNGAPLCGVCPVSQLCAAYQSGTQADFPVKKPKKPRRVEQRTVFILRCGELVAVQKRKQGGLLGGLWEFPNVEGTLTEGEALQQAALWWLNVREIRAGKRKKHIFTHIEWEMQSFVIDCEPSPDGAPQGDFLWVTSALLSGEIALPSAFAGFTEEAFR
ncbi:MAG: A/G-specific adenine glycosylase [Oscillospiraceae bacterium]